MSSISPVFSYEPVLVNHVPAFETGFTPWDSSDLFSIFDSPPVSQAEVSPGLEIINCQQNQNQGDFNPGYQDKPLNQTGLNVDLPEKDERLNKRKKSNRESARRSRMKRQKHLEETRSHFNQLSNENRVLKNQLRYVLEQCQLGNMENDRLRLEHHILHEKLLNLRQALVLRQFQQNLTCGKFSCINSTVVTVPQNPSMMKIT